MGTTEKRLSKSMNVKITGKADNAIVLVLAHWFGVNQSVWDAIVPGLSEHYRVVVFDWCFSGTVEDANLFDPVKYSSYDAFANDLNLILDENELTSTVFVGHSMSGMVGCIASVRRPELFKRLVLVGASPRYQNAEGYEGGFGIEDIEQMLTSIETNYDQWTAYFANLVVNSKNPSAVTVYRNHLLRMKPEVALPLAKAVFYSDHRDILPRVTTSWTIVLTTNDAIVPNSVAHCMHGWIAGESTVEVIETDGHYPQLTAPEQLLDVLVGVLGV